MAHDSISVRLVGGGLGNQLFGYYAAAALAARHSVGLTLDTSWTRRGFTDHGLEILKLDLPGKWIMPGSLRARLTAPRSLPERVFAKCFQPLRRPPRIHEAQGFGHDPELWHQPPGTELRGYFQSWQIVESAVQGGYPRRPTLRTRSPWLESVSRRALQEKPIVMHVRRGDYVKIPEFGLLAASYYGSAIEILRSQGITGPIWLFSDEPHPPLQSSDGMRRSKL